MPPALSQPLPAAASLLSVGAGKADAGASARPTAPPLTAWAVTEAAATAWHAPFAAPWLSSTPQSAARLSPSVTCTAVAAPTCMHVPAAGVPDARSQATASTPSRASQALRAVLGSAAEVAIKAALRSALGSAVRSAFGFTSGPAVGSAVGSAFGSARGVRAHVSVATESQPRPASKSDAADKGAAPAPALVLAAAESSCAAAATSASCAAATIGAAAAHATAALVPPTLPASACN
eukprot:16610-Chlamydomonas_euryale.AAC.14